MSPGPPLGLYGKRTVRTSYEVPPLDDGPPRIEVTGPALYRDLMDVAGHLYKRALTVLPEDVRDAIRRAQSREHDRGARIRLEVMADAIETSDRTGIIVCQDTGIPVYFLTVGDRFPIDMAKLHRSLAEGVAQATARHRLRSSVVHPLTRENPKTNTGRGVPVFHHEFVEDAEYLDIVLMPKGSGSENMSFLAMLTPADGLPAVKRFVLDSVISAGAKPCPPTVVGIGLGGTADECVALAKRATARPIGTGNPDPLVASLERELCDALNTLEIGAQGLGGATTAFDVHIEYAYTHISMLPVAVNLQCWRGERATARVRVDGSVTYA